MRHDTSIAPKLVLDIFSAKIRQILPVHISLRYFSTLCVCIFFEIDIWEYGYECMGTQGVIDETSKIFYWAHVKKRRSQKPKAKIH